MVNVSQATGLDSLGPVKQRSGRRGSNAEGTHDEGETQRQDELEQHDGQSFGRPHQDHYIYDNLSTWYELR